MLQMFLRSDVAEKIGRLYQSGVTPTAQQREDFRLARAALPKYSARVEGARPAAMKDPANYAVAGSIAQISVEGVLSEQPDFWAWLMGLEQTSYQDIRDSFALAAADPTVKSVVLDVSSPGGYTDGLFETLAAIEAFGKPITVQASQACSAAYALAAMAGPITPAGPASEFGSIGVACSFSFCSYIETIDVTSTEAPNKRPDPRTPEGKAVIVEQLDAIHDLFVDAIARGRTQATSKTVTVAQVNAGFGRGATMLAGAAYEAGLVDKKPAAAKRGGSKASDEEPTEPVDLPVSAIAAYESSIQAGFVTRARAVRTAPVASDTKTSPPCVAGQEKKRVNPMTEDELLAQFPQLHASMLAKGVAQGQAAERKRACAHLKLAKATGAREVAEAAIASGASTMDEDVHADYMAAAIGKRETSARQADSDEAGAIVGGAAPAAESQDLGDLVADRIEAMFGKKKAS